MNIGEVGFNFSSTKKLHYLSTETVLEYDALIIDFRAVFADRQRLFLPLYQKKANDLNEFLKHKNIPIIYIAPEVDKAELMTQVGTSVYHYHEITPIPELDLERESGSKIVVAANTPFTGFFNRHKEKFAYKTIFRNKPGTITASTPFTNKTLAFYTIDCVFIPDLKSFPQEQEKEFLDDLISAAKNIRLSNVLKPIPTWTENFLLPGEKEARNDIDAAKTEIEELNRRLEQKNHTLLALSENKRLFTASGDELEAQVEEIIRDLGIEVLESERNRDDLIIRYDNEVAVIEIKGLTGSAKEQNAAQLEKWTAAYFERTEVRPKGILLVNAYREKRLNEREESVFPHQMHKYSTSREHCLITTLQLLGLYFEAKSHPQRRDELIKTLFSTIGVYPHFTDWNQFIKFEENTSSDE
jgi:hypothetical protein